MRPLLLFCLMLLITVTLGQCADKATGWKPEPLKRPDALRAGA